MTHPEAERSVKQVVGELVSRRARAGVSLYRLAELSGLSREAIRLIENGQRSPTLHSLFLLSAALEVSLGTAVANAEK